jgi:hypothetical protein
MRRLAPALILFALSVSAQTWTQLSDFPGSARDDAASFTIGHRIYVGTGMDVGFQLTNDWWCFDTQSETWAPIAAIPTWPRQYCTGFTIADTGYVFGGVDANGALDQLWAYHPDQDWWEQKASIPAEARYACVAVTGFYANAIIATGMLASGVPTNEAWKYHADTDTWEAIPAVPGPARHRAACFLDDGGMRIVGGADVDNNALSDSWSYPIWFETGEWYTAPDLPAPRYGADGSGDYVTVLTGGATSPSEFHDDTWVLNGNTWSTVEAFPGGPRRGGVGAAGMGTSSWLSRFYYGTGSDPGLRYKDWWRLEYPIGIAENDVAGFSLSPVPADAELRVSQKETASISDLRIADLEGRGVLHERVSGNTTTIATSSLANGTYVITLHGERGRSSQRFTVLH